MRLYKKTPALDWSFFETEESLVAAGNKAELRQAKTINGDRAIEIVDTANAKVHVVLRGF